MNLKYLQNQLKNILDKACKKKVSTLNGYGKN